ncbi:MAG: 1-acyl-sn-glycerol-3-phosphate acyltransferase, partial [Microbacterium sp.]
MAPSSPRPPASAEKSRPSVFWPLAVIVVPLTGLFAKIEIIDGHKLPREGAYVLAPTHSTEFDPLIVAVAVW